MSETRKLASILVADVVGYCRLARADEERTHARLWGLRSDLIDPAIAANHGRIVKPIGDGSIIEFRSVLAATAPLHLIVRRTDSEQFRADTRNHEARSSVMVA